MNKLLFNGLKDNFQIILAELDPNGIFILTDGAGLERLGSKRGHSVGKSVFEIFKNNHELCSNVRRALNGETFIATVKVDNLFYETNYVPVFNKDHTLKKLVILSLDVTEQKRLEEELKRNEQRLRRAARISKTANWEYNAETGNFHYSHELLSIFEINKPSHGLSPEYFLEKIQPRDAQAVKSVFLKSVKNMNAGNVSFGILLADSKIKYLNVDWELEFDSEGRLLSVFGAAQDITDLGIKEKRILETELKVKNIYENMMEAAFTVDLSGKIISFNNSFKIMMGYTDTELYKLTYKDITPNKWHEYEDKILKDQVLVNGYSEVYEKEYIRKDGTVFPIELRINLIRDDENNPVEMWAFIRDISQRKKNEAMIRESEMRFHSAFDQAPIGMALVSLEGRVQKANRSLCSLFCFEEHELIGKTFHELTYPDDLIQDVQYVEKLLAGSIHSYEFEKRYINKFGNVIWAILSVSAVRGTDEKPLYFISQIKDITAMKQAEEMMSKQRAILNTSQRIAKVGGWQWDSENEKMYWTDELYALFEYEKSQFNPNLPQHIDKSLECYPATDRLIILEAFRNCIGRGIPYNIEAEFKTAKGKELFVRTAAEPIIRNGKITGAVGTLMDITTEKKSVLEIQKLSSAVEQSPLGILIADPDGKIEYCNSVCSDISGCGTDEILGKNLIEMFPRDLDKDISEVIGNLKCGELWHGQFQNINKQGGKYWEAVRISPICNGDGNILNLLLIQEDITLQKENEIELDGYRNMLEEMIKVRTDELLQSEEKFKALAENSEDMILRYDRNGDILYANRVVYKMFGDIPANLLNQKIDVSILRRDSDENWKTTLGQVFRSKKQERIETASADGIWYDWIIVPEFNEEMEVVSVLTSGRNITKIKSYENAIEVALKKEQELTELQKMFVSTVSHEFRTPLTSIITSVGLLEMSGMNMAEGKKKTHFERINRNVQLMTEMLDEVIFLNRSNIHKYEPMIEETDITGLCTVLFNEIKGEYPRVKSTVEINLHENLYPTDKNILSKILRNLITNAFKYNIPDGTVYFSAALLENRLEFIIRDTGLGIPSADQNRIFEPFSRASNSTGIKGTGLGLSIVRRAVEFLKGTVSFESTENEGTTFKVSIPIKLNGEENVHCVDN